MARAKKIFLVHERRETVRVRINKKTRRATCPRCREQVEWLMASEAAEFSGLSEREVFRLVEQDRVHFVESDLDPLLICRRSLCTFRPKTTRGRKM